jgi:putative cardiolipin synthase
MRRFSIPAVLLFLLAAAANADTVRILDDPREAMQARADVIRQAKRRVTMLYFLARDDRVTLAVLALLRDARHRGVGDVRVIVDGSFHRIPKAVMAHLRDEGIEVRTYHPFDLRHPTWLLHRMHEKVIVADGERYITGGRNLDESYFGLSRKRNFLDRDVYVEGASAVDADRRFDELWTSKDVSRMGLHASRRAKREAAEHLGDALEEMTAAGFIDPDETRDWRVGRMETSSVRFVPTPHVGDVVVDALQSAERSIVIESPYFIPPRFLREVLVKKLAEGVRVVVLTNSIRSTDGLLPQAAYLQYRHELARAGIDFREYKGPDTLHSKSIIIDGRLAMIGSYNIDPRSHFLNTEVMCVVDDEALAGELLRSVDVDTANAWVIDPAAPGLSLRIWAMQLLLPLLEHQL